MCTYAYAHAHVRILCVWVCAWVLVCVHMHVCDVWELYIRHLLQIVSILRMSKVM